MLADVHGENFMGISSFLNKSMLLHFGSYIFDKLQPGSHIGTWPYSDIAATEPHSYITTKGGGPAFGGRAFVEPSVAM